MESSEGWRTAGGEREGGLRRRGRGEGKRERVKERKKEGSSRSMGREEGKGGGERREERGREWKALSQLGGWSHCILSISRK